MEFYESIVKQYDKIFPFNPLQKCFVKRLCPSTGFGSVLDVGCGTGTLCLALSKDYSRVKGIDPDKMMLRAAKQKTRNSISNLHFLPYGMLDLEKYFDADQFDVILNFGNTLCHLKSAEEVLDFLTQARTVLQPGGKLLIQIINYDRVIEQHIKSLPTIENEQLKFTRDYHFDIINHQIHFKTCLQIKGEEKEIKNQISLNPVRKEELSKMLLTAGFDTFNFYGSFNREALQQDSIPLLVEAM
jgi:SAM-dependent methyltransferase